jgi:hypothetical protein
MVLNRHWCRSWHRCRRHRTSGSSIIGHTIELGRHPVGLIRQQRHTGDHGHEVRHAKIHDRLFVVMKRRLQVCGHIDRLDRWWLREDLLGLVQYIVMTTGTDVSILIVHMTEDGLRSVKEPDGMRLRKAGRELMCVDLSTGAAIEVDDFQSNTSRLEQDISQSLHSRMVNFDLMRVDVGIAVAGNSMGEHKRCVVFSTSLHPSRGKGLLEW